MKTLIRFSCLLFSLLLLSPLALGAATPTQEVAGILQDLNHYPSAEEKETLNSIAQDQSNSEAIRTIAAAVRDMEHKVSDEDAAKLEEIASDSSVGEQEQELARIVMDINHKPSQETMARLEDMSQ